MKIEILKVENGKIVEPEDWEMPACMTGCGGGGGGSVPVDPYCFSVFLCVCDVGVPP